MSEPTGRRGRTRRAPWRPSPAALGVVRLDADFGAEYPDADAASTAAHATLARAGTALLQEVDRSVAASFDLSQAAATALAVIDGAGSPLTPSQIGERLIAPSATMTATLDQLEGRGWIIRTQNPADRRSVLVEITEAGREVADRFLAGIRKLELATMSGLTVAEREQLLDLLGKVLERAAAVAADPPIVLDGRRLRPTRLAGSDSSA